MINPIAVCVTHNPFETLDRLLGLVASVGFAAVEWFETGPKEIWTDAAVAEKIRAAMRPKELVSQYHAPFMGSFDLGRDGDAPRPPESAALVIAHMLDRAERLGARLVTAHVGSCPPGLDRAEAMRNVMEGLRLATPDIERRRIRLALENHTPAYVKGPLGDRPEDFDWLLANLPSQWIGQNIDLGHANIDGHVDGFLSRPLDRVFNMHLHDNRGKADDHLALGKGGIDWESVLPRLARGGYAGPLTLEFLSEAEDYLRAINLIRAA